MAAKPKAGKEKLQEGTPPVQTLYAENPFRASAVNLNQAERWCSTISGGALAVLGLKKGGLSGLALALFGGGLIYRGTTGHSYAYDLLRINKAPGKAKRASVKHGEGIRVELSVTINRSPAELYQFWRNFENLPRVMSHLESVQVLDHNLSHWTTKAPAGMTAEWDAQIINEKENELIAWRSLEGATIQNAGSVQFKQASGGTIVKVEVNYSAPAGTVGVAIAKLFGEEPALQIAEDLRHFKQLMETGEIASTAGQPSGKQAKNETSRAKDASTEEDQAPAHLILSHGR
jgi:uncharacterized membrane protein